MLVAAFRRTGLRAGAAVGHCVAAIVAKGVKIAAADREFDLAFKADGAYADPSGISGKYCGDGKKLCKIPDAFGTELCNDYPDGKKAGDSFELTSGFGPLTVTMKQP